MKSKNFVYRSSADSIRGSKERKTPKQTNWDRIVYLVVLFIVLIILGRWTYNNFVIVHGQGYATASAITLRAPDDMIITGIQVHEGTVIERKDTLYSFTPIFDHNEDEESKTLKIKIDRGEAIDELTHKISVLQQELENLYEKRDFYRQKVQNVSQKIKLDIATIHDLEQVKRRLLDINLEIKKLRAELSGHYGKIHQIKNRPIPSTGGGGIVNNIYNIDSVFLPINAAPLSGTIGQVFVQPYETVFESEPIMQIWRKGAQPYIVAKFDREDAKYLMPGTVFNVKFSDGTKSKAVVKGYYSGSYDLRWKDWISAQKKDRIITVKLFPLEEKEAIKWLKRKGIGVELSRSIF